MFLFNVKVYIIAFREDGIDGIDCVEDTKFFFVQ